jgi:hypothetical protein
MIGDSVRASLEAVFCPCVTSNGNDMMDNGKPVTAPTRIGSSILLCGRRKSYFPNHCLVGPDWPFVVCVFFLIVVINGVVLGVVSPLGWPPVLIGIIGAIALLVSYSMTVFSDPGIVYKSDYSLAESIQEGDIEESSHTSTTPIRQAPNLNQATIECGNCQFQRPRTAHHCTYCKTCVEKLDHHCPW